MIRPIALAASTLLAAAPAHASFVLNFSGVPTGQTPLSLTTTDGNVVTFSSPSDPGGFAVSNALPFSALATGFTAMSRASFPGRAWWTWPTQGLRR